MNKETAIKLFQQKQIRSVWDDEDEIWYFSIVDVIAVLTDSTNPRKYWSVLKTRLKKEGSQLATNCSQLKMLSKSIEVRKELTNEWDERGVKKGKEYAILTDEITEAWSGFTVKKYKNFKGLKKENLRDNMTNLELVLNMLAEATTTEISKEKKPKNFNENKNIARQGGTIAGNTRKEIEAKTGKKVVSSISAKKLSATQNKKNKELKQ